jgi:hypothetical protein
MWAREDAVTGARRAGYAPADSRLIIPNLRVEMSQDEQAHAWWPEMSAPWELLAFCSLLCSRLASNVVDFFFFFFFPLLPDLYMYMLGILL